MADQERRFPATPHKRRQARQKGQVVKSVEVNTVFVLLGGFLLLRFLGNFMFAQLEELAERSFVAFPSMREITMQLLIFHAPGIVGRFLLILMPFLLGVGVVAFLANVLQVGFMSSWTSIKPRLDKLNPVNGFKRLFSLKSFAEGVKSVCKILIMAGVSYVVIRDAVPTLIYTLSMTPTQSVSEVSGVVMTLIFRLVMALGVLAILDFFYQRYEHEKSLRMSRQELKEEVIRYEGRPEVKQKRRSLQRQLAQRRMMQEVPKADVVITNPTHLAVAVQYDPAASAAPLVIAKGARLVAEKIIETAKENEVPVIENKPLAQALHKLVEVGQSVPVHLYQAVAEVLAYLHRIGKTKRKWL
ncbi:MAG: flagellar biosynthesis protein FlhB [Candidatus Omnitrophica bacterium]|nr:flagellar biosynthesis protein FlhB [Candidatus Omnitrophota bacterium]